MRIREAAVAGLFYPQQPEKLRAAVRQYLNDAVPSNIPAGSLKAIVGPHAGYVYSGPIAGSAYAPLKDCARRIRRVVLFSPAHRVYVKGMAASSAEVFRSPLGQVALDHAAVDGLLKLPGVQIHDAAHAPEHGVETHLPFLQEILGASGWTLVPLLVGEAEPGDVVPVLEALWGGPETLVVISSDLSHFLDYASARELDGRTAKAIVDLAPERFVENSACGRIPLAALLAVAKEKGLRAAQLDLRNSGDTAGSREQVVGYGAFVIA